MPSKKHWKALAEERLIKAVKEETRRREVEAELAELRNPKVTVEISPTRTGKTHRLLCQILKATPKGPVTITKAAYMGPTTEQNRRFLIERMNDELAVYRTYTPIFGRFPGEFIIPNAGGYRFHPNSVEVTTVKRDEGAAASWPEPKLTF